MLGSAPRTRFIREVAEDSEITVNVQSDHCAPVLHAKMPLEGLQSVAYRFGRSHQQAEEPERRYSSLLPNEEPKVRTARPLDAQAEKVAESAYRYRIVPA